MNCSMLRFVCVLILFVSVVDLAGKSRKKKSVSADVSDDLDAINDIPMELRSLEHWNSLPRETLKLICTDLHINLRGDRVTLVRRLHEHFHVHPSLNVPNPPNQVTVPTNPPNQVTVPTNQALPNISNDIAALVRLEVQRQVAINIGVASNVVGSSNNVINSALPPAAVKLTPNSDRQEGVPLQQQQPNLLLDTATVQPDFMASTNNVNFNLPNQHTVPNINLPTHQRLPMFLNPAATAASLHQYNVDIPAAYSQQQQQQLAHMHPAVQPAQLKKIKNREYVDFNLLLPNSSVTPGSYSVHVDPLSSPTDTDGTTTLSLVPRTGHNKIIDFFSWLLAWNNFMRTYIFYHPEMAPQLLFYQSMICKYVQQHIFEEVQTFDRNFRIRIANGKEYGLRWDRFDHELVARYLRTFKPTGYKCKKFGHFASVCTSSSDNSAYQSTFNNNRQQQPFHAPPAAFKLFSTTIFSITISILLSTEPTVVSPR